MLRLGLTNLREVKLMNGIWVPIAITAVLVLATVADLWDDWEKFKEEWLIACSALCIKPGLFIAVVWVVWSSFN